MPVDRPKKIRFIPLLWLATAIAIIWLLSQPLAMNAWAKSHWTQTPCHAVDEDVFYFRVDGVKYMCTRRDFWMSKYFTEKARLASSEPEINDICWVNPANPLQSVLRLDAFTPWNSAISRDRAISRIAIAVLLLAVTAMLTYFDPQKTAARKKKAAS